MACNQQQCSSESYAAKHKSYALEAVHLEAMEAKSKLQLLWNSVKCGGQLEKAIMLFCCRDSVRKSRVVFQAETHFYSVTCGLSLVVTALVLFLFYFGFVCFFIELHVMTLLLHVIIYHKLTVNIFTKL